jgi:hypothetical protein
VNLPKALLEWVKLLNDFAERWSGLAFCGMEGNGTEWLEQVTCDVLLGINYLKFDNCEQTLIVLKKLSKN